jgi:hypothetical protein
VLQTCRINSAEAGSGTMGDTQHLRGFVAQLYPAWKGAGEASAHSGRLALIGLVGKAWEQLR